MITAQTLADVTERMFGRQARGISQPGGSGRASVRVHFDDGSVIATYRSDPLRRETEARVLAALSAAGAPVPRFLGQSDGILFQEDVGARRLSVELSAGPPSSRTDLARRAMESIQSLKRAAHAIGLPATLPGIASNPEWTRGFLSAPAVLSNALGLECPRIDAEALAQAIAGGAERFVKWDTRPGNAAVQPDGSVVWFDWEHCGRRGGLEDLAFLLGDEFWTLSTAQSVAVLGSLTDVDPEASFLAHFTSLQIVQRLLLIRQRLGQGGWVDAAQAMQHDLVGASAECIGRLAENGAFWASRDPLTAPLADWFLGLAERDRATGQLRNWPDVIGLL